MTYENIILISKLSLCTLLKYATIPALPCVHAFSVYLKLLRRFIRVEGLILLPFTCLRAPDLSEHLLYTAVHILRHTRTLIFSVCSQGAAPYLSVAMRSVSKCFLSVGSVCKWSSSFSRLGLCPSAHKHCRPTSGVRHYK